MLTLAQAKISINVRACSSCQMYLLVCIQAHFSQDFRTITYIYTTECNLFHAFTLFWLHTWQCISTRPPLPFLSPLPMPLSPLPPCTTWWFCSLLQMHGCNWPQFPRINNYAVRCRSAVGFFFFFDLLHSFLFVWASFQEMSYLTARPYLNCNVGYILWTVNSIDRTYLNCWN